VKSRKHSRANPQSSFPGRKSQKEVRRALAVKGATKKLKKGVGKGPERDSGVGRKDGRRDNI